MLTPIKCINFKRKRTTEVFFHCISFLIFSLISRLLSFNGKLKYFSLINVSHKNKQRAAISMMTEIDQLKKQHERLLKAQDEWQKQLLEAQDGRRAAEKRADAAESARLAAEELTKNPKKALVLKEINEMKKKKRMKGDNLYHKNQEETAMKIVKNINDDEKVFQMVLAPCQSGKTGCMMAVIDLIMTSDCDIDVGNIFVITGLSSNDWCEQTKRRLPESLRQNVFHRGQLLSKMSLFSNMKNAVIMIDEVHIASNDKNTINKFFEKLGFKNFETLKTNNIQIVEFSATPNTTLKDLLTWNNASVKHVMKPGNNYKGHKTLIDDFRIYQMKDLYICDDNKHGMSEEDERENNQLIQPALDAIQELRLFIAKKYTNPKFHLIRTPSKDKASTVIGRFKQEFGKSCKYISCDSDSMNDLKKELKKLPICHTFLFVKESARCALTFTHKRRIGVMYDRISKTINDDVMVQGFAGRACGYDVSDDMVVFTNIPSIERYITMVESDFEDTKEFRFHGSSKRKRKLTFNHSGTYSNTNECDILEEKDDYEYVTHNEYFDSMTSLREFLSKPEVMSMLKVDKAPRPRDVRNDLRKQCGGYAVSARIPRTGKKSATLTSDDRLTKSMAKDISSDLCLQGKTICVLALPVYESMETLPDQEVYELRYRKEA